MGLYLKDIERQMLPKYKKRKKQILGFLSLNGLLARFETFEKVNSNTIHERCKKLLQDYEPIYLPKLLKHDVYNKYECTKISAIEFGKRIEIPMVIAHLYLFKKLQTSSASFKKEQMKKAWINKFEK